MTEKVRCVYCGKDVRQENAIHITSRSLPEYNDKFSHKRCFKKI
jgi:hypothetical protein